MTATSSPEASTLKLRSVSALLGERFFVPAYQRGYRWTPREVTALLDDLAAFRNSTRAPEDWYCLQPVVVLPRGDSWEVVDGQQRLTTMHLLLTALRDLGPAGAGPLPHSLRDTGWQCRLPG